MPAMNMMPGGNTLQIPLDAPTAFASEAGNAEVSLTWTDPNDKYATPEGETAQDPDQLVSVWSHTVLVRKTGSQPAGPNDGTVVISSSVRNQYQSTPYVDTGLTNDTVYYYGVFAYNEDGVASPGAFTNATPGASTPLSQLAEGTLIKILENGSPVEFYLAKHNYESGLNGQGRELVVRKDVYQNRQWNTSDRNAWGGSALRSWLNGAYKNMFSDAVKGLMGTTKYNYYSGLGNSSDLSSRSDAVFILDGGELGISYPDTNFAGAKLPISNTLKIAHLNGETNSQWTRTPYTWMNNTTSAIWIWASGDVSFLATSSSCGARPCFTLPADAFIDTDLNLVES